MKKIISGTSELSFFNIRLLLLTVLIQVSSLRNFFVASSLSNPLLAWVVSCFVIYLLLFLMFWLWQVPLINKPLSSWKLTILLLIVFYFIGTFLYARMEGLNKGGTGDDAMEQPILAMMQGKGPYEVRLFDNAPISPGLGWLLLNAPFTVLGISSLLNVFYMGLTMLALNVLTKKATHANMLLLATMLCFSAWEQVYSYHDLLAIGFAFTLLFLLVEHYSTDIAKTLLLGVLTGVVATSRIIFIFIPFLLAFIIYKRNPKIAILYAFTGTFTATGIHFIGYVTSEYYQPLHIIGRGYSNIPMWMIVLGITITGIIFLSSLKNNETGFQNDLFWFSILLVVPLFFISTGELVGRGFDLKTWEAAHYLLPALPSILLLLINS